MLHVYPEITKWSNKSAHQILYYMNQTRYSILIDESPTHISLFNLISIIVSQEKVESVKGNSNMVGKESIGTKCSSCAVPSIEALLLRGRSCLAISTWRQK